MASRRMFSKRIINSARFLKMPVSTQCLYFHLGLQADDDGVVEAYTVMNAVGASEDDLRVLVAKGFVYILNEDLVAYIMDWHENNKIRADRKVDSMYKDLLLKVLPDVKLVEKKRRADLKSPDGQPMDNQWTTNGQPMDGIGKDRLGEVSIGQDNILCAPDDALIEEKPKKPSKAEIDEFFEKVWKLYPNKKGKGQVSDAKKKVLYGLGYEAIEQAIDRYLNELKKDDWRKPQNGSTFFNSGYVDYLDGNYEPRQDVKEELNQSKWSGADVYKELVEKGVIT